jgi:hypothetical protein
MLRIFIYALLLLYCSFFPHIVPAAQIFLKDGKAPLLGKIVQRSEQQLMVETWDRTQGVRERIVPLASVGEIQETVAITKLAELSPENPAGYRDYAEALAAKSADLEARETALRLYTIAFALQRNELGKSCLLGMIALARSPQEEQKFRAALYVVDSEMPLSQVKATAIQETELSTQKELEDCLLQLRKGEKSAAKRILERAPVKALCYQLQGFLSYESLVEACSEDTVSMDRQRQLLQLEVELRVRRLPSFALLDGTQPASQWSQEVKRGGDAPVLVLDLEHLTEFDPQATKFSNRQWTAP